MNAAVTLELRRIESQAILVSQLFGDQREGIFEALCLSLVEATSGHVCEGCHQLFSFSSHARWQAAPSSAARKMARGHGIEKAQEFRPVVDRINHGVGFG